DATGGAYQRAVLAQLAKQYPSEDAALSEIARLSAELTLPKGTVHVISDVHGEDKKLRHVINNASGTLRPLLETLFAGTMNAQEFKQFITLIFYPFEVVSQLEATFRDREALRLYAQDRKS